MDNKVRDVLQVRTMDEKLLVGAPAHVLSLQYELSPDRILLGRANFFKATNKCWPCWDLHPYSVCNIGF